MIYGTTTGLILKAIGKQNTGSLGQIPFYQEKILACAFNCSPAMAGGKKHLTVAKLCNDEEC